MIPFPRLFNHLRLHIYHCLSSNIYKQDAQSIKKWPVHVADGCPNSRQKLNRFRDNGLGSKRSTRDCYWWARSRFLNLKDIMMLFCYRPWHVTYLYISIVLAKKKDILLNFGQSRFQQTHLCRGVETWNWMDRLGIWPPRFCYTKCKENQLPLHHP